MDHSLSVAAEFDLPAEAVRHMASFIQNTNGDISQRGYALNHLDKWNQNHHNRTTTALQKLALQLAAIESIERTTFEETADLRAVAGLLEEVI